MLAGSRYFVLLTSDVDRCSILFICLNRSESYIFHSGILLGNYLILGVVGRVEDVDQRDWTKFSFSIVSHYRINTPWRLAGGIHALTVRFGMGAVKLSCRKRKHRCVTELTWYPRGRSTNTPNTLRQASAWCWRSAKLGYGGAREEQRQPNTSPGESSSLEFTPGSKKTAYPVLDT
jgi:hypothetical protein